jgi:hypothetical protein
VESNSTEKQQNSGISDRMGKQQIVGIIYVSENGSLLRVAKQIYP